MEREDIAEGYLVDRYLFGLTFIFTLFALVPLLLPPPLQVVPLERQVLLLREQSLLVLASSRINVNPTFKMNISLGVFIF